MKRLPTVLGALAVAGLAVALLWRLDRSNKILAARLDRALADGTALQARLHAADTANTALETRLTALDADLGRAKTRLTNADARNVQLARELADTRTALAARDAAELALNGQIETLKQDLAGARAATVAPEAVAAYKNTIADLERQLADARKGAAIPGVAGAATAVFTAHAAGPSAPPAKPPPAAATAPPSVLSIGPANAFVVLNYGAVNGACAGQSLAIRRSGEIVATVLVSDVRPNFCIAQVQPDSLHGVLQKGDSAVLTN